VQAGSDRDKSMRVLAAATVLLALVAMATALFGGCSAVDDFTRFSFTDGGTGGGDLSGVPGFGEACTTVCNGTLLSPLTCFKDFGGKEAPGGICTRPCGNQLACSSLPNAMCLTVQGTAVCLPTCNGGGCRSGYQCCANRDTTNGPGACAPSTTDFCGH
jgi:hypothetical protein